MAVMAGAHRRELEARDTVIAGQAETIAGQADRIAQLERICGRRISSQAAMFRTHSRLLRVRADAPCASRAAHAAHPSAGGGSPVTGHHDQDRPTVSKPTR